MPFSLFALRCIWVSQQPLKYRQNVINNLYKARMSIHACLLTTMAGAKIVSLEPKNQPQPK